MKPKSRTFKLTFAVNYFRRWEYIKGFGAGTGIVTEINNHKGATTISIKPYKRPKNKWLAMLKFMWLKIQVHYS